MSGSDLKAFLEKTRRGRKQQSAICERQAKRNQSVRANNAGTAEFKESLRIRHQCKAKQNLHCREKTINTGKTKTPAIPMRRTP